MYNLKLTDNGWTVEFIFNVYAATHFELPRNTTKTEMTEYKNTIITYIDTSFTFYLWNIYLHTIDNIFGSLPLTQVINLFIKKPKEKFIIYFDFLEIGCRLKSSIAKCWINIFFKYNDCTVQLSVQKQKISLLHKKHWTNLSTAFLHKLWVQVQFQSCFSFSFSDIFLTLRFQTLEKNKRSKIYFEE